MAGSRGIFPDSALSIQPALDSALPEAPRSFVITVIINALAPFRSHFSSIFFFCQAKAKRCFRQSPTICIMSAAGMPIEIKLKLATIANVFIQKSPFHRQPKRKHEYPRKPIQEERQGELTKNALGSHSSLPLTSFSCPSLSFSSTCSSAPRPPSPCPKVHPQSSSALSSPQHSSNSMVRAKTLVTLPCGAVFSM